MYFIPYRGSAGTALPVKRIATDWTARGSNPVGGGTRFGRAYALPTTFSLQSVLTQTVYGQATTNSHRD